MYRRRNDSSYKLGIGHIITKFFFPGVTVTGFLSIKFSEMDYIIGLTNFPDFKLIIWNWRTGEKTCSQETNMKYLEQSLKYKLIFM